MSVHDWWRHYGEPQPNPLPSSFLDVPEHLARVTTSPPVYYLLGAMALRLTNTDNLVAQLYLLRWMALALAIPILLCIWAGARRLFGVHVAIGATLLTALHPQFVLTATAANPDVLVFLCAAVIWWQGARLLTGGPAAINLVVMGFATVTGILTKRIAAPLVLMLAVVPWIAVRSGRPAGQRRVVARAVGLVACGLMLVGLGAIAWFGDEVMRLRQYWAAVVTLSWSDRARDWTYFVEYTTELLDSAWLVAGWLRYPAPDAWLTAVRLLTVTGLAGCAIGARRGELATWRAGLALAGAQVAIQTGGVYVGFYLNAFTAQGRYLFPVIGPFMALLWVGIHSWWPRRLWPFVSTVLVALMLALDVLGWTFVIIPAYLG